MSEMPRLPLRTRIAMLLRLLAVQGAWNYETMMGNGIAFTMEPALRLLPGGRDGEAYRTALARQSGYFNAHPYLAGLAVGGLARAELDGNPEPRIERFRGACCGPLGSVGDRLVWAGWLPLCSLLGLLAYGFGGSPLLVVLVFLGTYNAGHLALRIWTLEAGWRQGLRIAETLGNKVFRDGPSYVARVNAALAGLAIPLVVARVVGRAPLHLVAALLVTIGWTVAVHFIARRVDGWRAALVGVAAYALIGMLR